MGLYINNLVKYKGLDEYLDSEYCDSLVLGIAKKFGIDVELLNNLAFNLVEADFNLNEIDSLLETSKITNDNRSAIAIEFLGLIFLPLQAIINKDISAVIKKLGGNPEAYKGAILNYKDYVDSIAIDNNVKYLDLLESQLDMESESRYVVDLFSSNIVLPLQDNNIESISSLNSAIAYLLNSKTTLSKELATAIINNQQELFNKALIINGRKENSTIANWMRDFIGIVGGGYFDAIDISKYLISSDNSKKLSDEELNILRKLINVYRAVKFFPRVFIESGQKIWHIFPVDSSVAGIARELAADKNKTVTNEVESEPKPPQNTTPEQNRHLAELMLEANKYPVGSLERRAVESAIAEATADKEEIKRVQN